MSYLIDTNIFGWLVAGKFAIEDLPKGDYLVTHIQVEELVAANEKETRTRLTIAMAALRPKMVNTETAVAGVSRADLANASDGVLFEKLRSELDALNKGKENNVMDALIGRSGQRSRLCSAHGGQAFCGRSLQTTVARSNSSRLEAGLE